MSEDAERLVEVLLRAVAFGLSCWAVWALGLLLYRLSEKFYLESHMVKQMLIQAGVQLP